MRKQFESAGQGAEEVDAFGLGASELGAAKGANASMWGAVAGTGVGTLTSIGARQFGAPGGFLERNAEWAGFGAGALASLALGFTGKGRRSAAWTGLAAAFLNNGLRAIEGMMFAPATAGPVIRPVTAFMNGAQGSGVGMAELRPTTAFLGQHGDAPQLLGTGIAQGSQQVQLVGGPALSEHASHWGATHFGGR